MVVLLMSETSTATGEMMIGWNNNSLHTPCPPGETIPHPEEDCI